MGYATHSTRKIINVGVTQRIAPTILDLATFSIVARDSQRQEFGIAIATARPNVGSLVPFVSVHGAIATQARVNTDLGSKGLRLLERRISL